MVQIDRFGREMGAPAAKMLEETKLRKDPKDDDDGWCKIVMTEVGGARRARAAPPSAR